MIFRFKPLKLALHLGPKIYLEKLLRLTEYQYFHPFGITVGNVYFGFYLWKKGGE